MTTDGYPLGADCDVDAIVSWRTREIGDDDAILMSAWRQMVDDLNAHRESLGLDPLRATS